MGLSNIDKSIYEALRRALVERDLIPDITIANTSTAYNIELDRIKSNNVTPIELKGIGKLFNRDAKLSNYCVLTRLDISAGDISYFGAVVTGHFPGVLETIPQPGVSVDITQRTMPKSIFNIMYEWRVITDTEEAFREVFELLIVAFMSYIPLVDTNGDDIAGGLIYCGVLGEKNVSSTNVSEHVVTIMAYDVTLLGPKPGTLGSQIVEIDLDLLGGDAEINLVIT